MSRAISILKIQIDGHFRGGEPVYPWVAEIVGPDPKYGLERNFIRAMTDWSKAHRSMRGNIYGRVSHFALREGGLYEVQQCRGKSSKQHVVREFVHVKDGEPVVITHEEALSLLDGGTPGTLYRMAVTDHSWVARITGLGTPARLGWTTDDKRRLYRLAHGGVFEIMEEGRRRTVGNHDGELVRLNDLEAWEWLTTGAARLASTC
jgi:hypothetical protein